MPSNEMVTRVIDGTTFETANRKRPIRLAYVGPPEYVDPPERAPLEFPPDPQKLKDLIEGRKVAIQTLWRDYYGRSVANVRVGGQSVNAAMRA